MVHTGMIRDENKKAAGLTVRVSGGVVFSTKRCNVSKESHDPIFVAVVALAADDLNL